MDEKKEASVVGSIMLGLIVGVALLMLVISLAAAQVEAGPVCWQLAPFDDTLSLEATTPVPGFFILQDVFWDGAGIYSLNGGGQAVVNSRGSDGFLSSVLHNPSSIFFSGNPLCLFEGHISASSLNGQWSIRCFTSGPESPDFTQLGQLVQQACGFQSLRVSAGHRKPYLAGE